MIVLSWNYRGKGHSAAISFLCYLVRTRRRDVIFLCDTITDSNKMEEVRVRLHYDCCFVVDSVGRSGGLCILWNSSSLCNIVSYSNNHTDFIMNVGGNEWRFKGFYGMPK